MSNNRRVSQIIVRPEKLTKFQLPRSYTLDYIDVNGKSDNTYLQENSKSSTLQLTITQLKKNLKGNEYKWLSIVLFTILISTTVGFSIALTTNNDCWSATTLQTAVRTLDYLDDTVDPCDNFYKFACGNFQRDERNHKSMSMYGIPNSVETKLRAFFEELHPNQTLNSYTKLKTVYHICGNSHTASAETEEKAFKTILREVGGWPIVDDKWNENNFNWINLTSIFRKIGVPFNHFFEISVDKDASLYQLMISSMTKQNLFRKDEQKITRNLAIFMGGKANVVEKDLLEAELFKVELEKIIIKHNTKPIKTVVTIKEFQKRYPDIIWHQYLNNIVHPGLKITDELFIAINIQNLDEVLKLILRTPKRVLSNYLIGRIAYFAIHHLPKLYFKIFHEKLEMDAFRIAIESHPLLIRSWYITNFFDEKTIQNVEQILKHVKSEIRNGFKDADWLDETTKNEAFNKLTAMKEIVGFPQQLLNVDTKEFYTSLIIDNSTCLQTVMGINKFHYDIKFSAVNTSTVADWKLNAMNVFSNEAFYHLYANEIEIPAAFVLDNLYNKPHPSYINYAVFGFIIIREILHGFDSNGATLNSKGNWWSPQTKTAFEQKSQCMVDQYQKLQLFNTPINGSLTLLENIADNGALKFAYKAWISNKKKKEEMPGLDYNSKQLFWISFAQNLCDKISEDDFKELYVNNVYAPNSCRVIGTLSNLQSFSKDFDCPKDAPMNSPTKCVLW